MLSRRISSSILRMCSTQTTPPPKTTHFGFQSVHEDKKAEKVHEVFRNVASRYDVMNDAMSLGVHRVWKDEFVERLGLLPGVRLLDVAGGTGDISFRCVDILRNSNHARQSHITVLDINENMLEVGRKRAIQSGRVSDDRLTIDWLHGDAEDLKLPDETFTAYTVAFGIRNCTHIDKVLTEAYRVLKPGGRFACLEFSKLEVEPLQRLYDLYSFNVIPVMGQLIAGQWRPYEYLVESIRKFPDQDAFKAMIEAAGFRNVSYENFTLGVCAMHSGFKI